ncbi:MAG TPA: type I-E CRISPR-associated protein Cse2/CasB [Xanthobacteraceae bacterium]|jgi:CRISPR system Cascade subunit CasB|nr:type I-E CRISPR-associated protein Cse2/CasB [Xanthobacteraceae bacterium]
MTGDADKPYKSGGAIILGWWRANLRPDPDIGPARGLRARLRRAAHVVDVLAEPQVVALHDALGRRHDPVRLAALASLLAAVERHEDRRIARAFGGDEPHLSHLRFQRLIRSDGAALALALRRALPLVGHACNVAALGEDFLKWDERVRVRWCFDYFGKAPPDAPAAASETEETA